MKVILHPLWNLHFKVGHQIRQGSDFKSLTKRNMESYTAFLGFSLPRWAIVRLLTNLNATSFPRLVKKDRDRFLEGTRSDEGCSLWSVREYRLPARAGSQGKRLAACVICTGPDGFESLLKLRAGICYPQRH